MTFYVIGTVGSGIYVADYTLGDEVMVTNTEFTDMIDTLNPAVVIATPVSKRNNFLMDLDATYGVTDCLRRLL